MPEQKIIITLDGWSSCGKSTLAKALARALGYVFVDSGAMYRAITLFFYSQPGKHCRLYGSGKGIGLN